ncbi:MAG: K(+)-transporting ATPase subunit C [Acidimicrobiales bacterium]
MRRQLPAALGMLLVFTVLTGLLYPLVVTSVATAVFHDQAGGSLVEQDGVPVGSRLIGQPFTESQYFHPRPSAAGDGYDAAASSGSNLGPTNDKLLDAVSERVTAYRSENGLAPDDDVPIDAVTASASGLDPHISVANARLQAPRVAQARAMPVERVLAMVRANTDGRDLGVLGEPGVNVLTLNLALDGR